MISWTNLLIKILAIVRVVYIYIWKICTVIIGDECHCKQGVVSELPQSQGFKLVISWVTEEANARVYIRVFFAFR
jgi:hypothetical protein